MPFRYAYRVLLALSGVLCMPLALATVVAGVRGVVHDPQSPSHCGRDRYPACSQFRFRRKRKDQC